MSPPEADEFSSSRKLRGTQGIPPTAGQVTGGLFFWFVFFGQAKKMNNMTAFRRIGRTYPGRPPEVVGLEITNNNGKILTNGNAEKIVKK